MSTPLISVIIPVHNGAAHVEQAVASILGQSFRDLEIIIIDDHSSDGTREILKRLIDPRIVVTSPAEHRHLTHALNHARKLASGRYIARMDADDVAHRERIERQFLHLEANPHVGILGTQVTLINSEGERLEGTPPHKPLDHAEVALGLLFGCPLWHPTVMMRREVLEELDWYGSDAIAGREAYSGEDYDLWCRAIDRTKVQNLPEVLLDYRIHNSNLSLAASGRTEHCRNTILVVSRFLERRLEVHDAEKVAACLLGHSPEGYPLPTGFSGSKCFLSALKQILEYGRQQNPTKPAIREFESRLVQVLVRGLFAQGTGIFRNLLLASRSSPRIALGGAIASLRRIL